jgi:hypothetical protein
MGIPVYDHWFIDPLKLLNFDCNADMDPAFYSNVDPDLDPASKYNADLDPQPCLKGYKKKPGLII